MFRIRLTEHLTIKRIGCFLFLISFSFLIIGCSEEEEGGQVKVVDSSEDKNITAIKAVVENEFTGPNEEFIRLRKNIGNKLDEINENLPEGKRVGAIPMDSPEMVEYNEFINKTYGPYFMDYAYDKLVPQNFVFAFQYQFDENDHYQMTVRDIEVKQEKDHPTIYRFTFLVEFENSNGETSQHNLSGEAICPEEGKIGRIIYQDAFDLMDQIYKDAES